MVLTPSTMLPLGIKAPDFHLLDTVSGKVLSLKDLRSDIATVVMFICNHCPYVKHLQTQLVSLVSEYEIKGASFIAINSNDITNYPEDSPEKMKLTAKEFSYSFPYLYDENQETAKAYKAACTPDFYIFDKDLKLAYRGQFDDSRPGSKLPITGQDLRLALDCLLKHQAVTNEQKPSIGCNIKWKNSI